ncbi:MAG TPA: 50S ribosomal protein L10 [Candidatus Limnocylindria bacterium]|jgi:large subunit ribosomal protein L10|nr:50S ribosomal protein L10 [Candidatus Limnocylindria bacterium]
MPTDAKRQAVSELTEMLRGSSALAVADYRGLTVSEMHTVRRSLRSNGVSLKIAKNRLLKIAADEAGVAELKTLLDGPTAIAATSGDEVSLARALQDAFRPYKMVTIRGGLLSGQPVSASDLQRLASLPSREVLLARLAGGMAAPLTGMAGVLAGNLRNLIGVLNAVVDAKRATDVGVAGDAAATEASPPEAAESAAESDSADVAPTEAIATEDAASTADESPPEESPVAESPAEESSAEADSATDDDPPPTE